MPTKRYTLADIRDANAAAGRYFFSRDTMKHFGDTMKHFKAINRKDGRVFIERVKEGRKAPKGFKSVGEIREFNPATGDIGIVLSGEKLTEAGF